MQRDVVIGGGDGRVLKYIYWYGLVGWSRLTLREGSFRAERSNDPNQLARRHGRTAVPAGRSRRCRRHRRTGPESGVGVFPGVQDGAASCGATATVAAGLNRRGRACDRRTSSARAERPPRPRRPLTRRARTRPPHATQTGRVRHREDGPDARLPDGESAAAGCARPRRSGAALVRIAKRNIRSRPAPRESRSSPTFAVDGAVPEVHACSTTTVISTELRSRRARVRLDGPVVRVAGRAAHGAFASRAAARSVLDTASRRDIRPVWWRASSPAFRLCRLGTRVRCLLVAGTCWRCAGWPAVSFGRSAGCPTATAELRCATGRRWSDGFLGTVISLERAVGVGGGVRSSAAHRARRGIPLWCSVNGASAGATLAGQRRPAGDDLRSAAARSASTWRRWRRRSARVVHRQRLLAARRAARPGHAVVGRVPR